MGGVLMLIMWLACKCAFGSVSLNADTIYCLADFLGDFNTASALDVVFFVREIMETNTELRGIILLRLMESFKEIRSSRVCSSALWIIGEYCNSINDITAAMEVSTWSLFASKHHVLSVLW